MKYKHRLQNLPTFLDVLSKKYHCRPASNNISTDPSCEGAWVFFEECDHDFEVWVFPTRVQIWDRIGTGHVNTYRFKTKDWMYSALDKINKILANKPE